MFWDCQMFLRNQRSEVLKNFKETFRKHELGKLWLNDHHCLVGRVGTGLRFAHRCRKHAIPTKLDCANIIAESISVPMRCHSVVYGMARQTRSANAFGYRCIFLTPSQIHQSARRNIEYRFPRIIGLRLERSDVFRNDPSAHARGCPLPALPSWRPQFVPRIRQDTIQNANLARAEARAALRVIDCLIFLWEYRLDAGGLQKLSNPERILVEVCTVTE